MNWTTSVLIICFIATVVAAWIEFRRENRARLGWRVAATIAAVGALACIALPISYHKNNLSDGNTEAILLTENYNTDSLSNYKWVFTTEPAIKKHYPKAILLTSVGDVNNFRPEIKQLRIEGYGLQASALRQINAIALTYHSQAAPAGIQTINWQQRLKTGEHLVVEGKYSDTTAKPVSLILKGLNTTADSVTISANKTSTFELSTTPKATGHYTYLLLAMIGKDTIEKENIPLMVDAAKPLSVLMLSASPDFESRFLKNWLSQNGFAVASRSVITKNKISQDFANMDKMPLDHLSSSVFQKFDVVIGDLSALKELPATESEAIKQQVEQDGLGVIIRADSVDKSNSWLQSSFRLNVLSTKTATSVPLFLANGRDKSAPLNVDPVYINDNENQQNLVNDPQKHILASSDLLGRGKLVFTTLHNTYTWVLSGSNKDYTALWSLLINKAARKSAPTENWVTTGNIASVGQPTTLQYNGATAPANVKINNTAVAVKQSPTVPYQWTVTYWPETEGWHQISTANSAPAWWYVYGDSSWTAIHNLEKINDTKNYISSATKSATVTKQIQQSLTTEVPKMYFYLLLLACCTFLWVERKLTT